LATFILVSVGSVNGQVKPPAKPKEVAIFLACECPISQKYVSTLNELYLQYNKESNLKWHFIIPDRIKQRDLDQFVKEYNVRFPLERDTRRHKMVGKFQPDVTPQAVILDDNRVLYSGAVDNWFYGLGQYRQVITEHYFKDALDAVLRGEQPPIQKTEAVGCPIARR